MAVFDIPPQAHPQGCVDKGEKVPVGCCFTATPPIKLLQRCLECWIPEVAPIRYEEAKEPEKIGLEPKGMYVQDGPQSGTRAEIVVSTKADDAEAFTEMWNDRIWERCSFCPQARTAFASKFEGRCPLDAIRGACLRRWRKNVLRSLLQYLRQNHGETWSSSCRDHPSWEIMLISLCRGKLVGVADRVYFVVLAMAPTSKERD